MSALDKKLRRDLWRLKGQVLTIALVLACGIMAMIMLRSSYQSLLAARDSYYTEFRFADVFARVERAPRGVATRLGELPGVALAYPRIVEDVMIPLADEPDPVTGRIISIPDDGAPPLNALYLRAGRLPAIGASDEAVVLEQFAEGHGLVPGQRIPVVINGRLRQVHLVGIALSPEYVLAMSGFEIMPDKRRFAVLWMLQGSVAPAFEMEGAFNDVALRLEPGAAVASVLSAIDRELAPYGGLHAVPRDKQMSNWALSGELEQLRTLAMIIPTIFLAVAAFLVNVVVSRLVYLERTQIAVLKALGFTDRRIALHYLLLVTLVVALAGVLGIALGARTAAWMTDLYTDFYRFPTRLLHISPGLVAVTLAIGAVSAIAGALGSVLRIARMPPAQAMRPPAPLLYRRSLLERLGLRRLVGPSAMMIVREIERKPFRFLLSTLGIALGVSIFVMGRFSWDSFDRLMSDQFLRVHREDLTVVFSHAVPANTVHTLEALPGVDTAEGVRMLGVRVRVGARWRDTSLTALPERPILRQLLDGARPLTLPDHGLVMTDKLAEVLGVAVGDEVELDVLEGEWRTYTVPVAGTIAEPFGLPIYARTEWLERVLGEAPRISTALIAVEPGRLDDVRAQLKEIPAVRSVASTEHAIRNYREQTGESMLVMTIVLTLSAAAIATGVVYNNARIALSMRSRDLASMRVLGFTRREISGILLGELGAQVVLGIPLGFVVGHWWAQLFAQTMDPEAVRFPLYVAPRTYAVAAVIALVSALASALLVRRKLDHLDLVSVLKASE